MGYLGPQSQVSRAGLPPAALYSCRFGFRLGAPGGTCCRDGASLPSSHSPIQPSFLTCRIEFVILAVTPIADRRRQGDRREPRPGRSGCHQGPGSTFRSSPTTPSRAPDDGAPAAARRVCSGVDISYLDPDHHRVPGRADCVPRDLEQVRAEEEHYPGIGRGPNSQ
jgi:hypothetical protein